MTRLAEQRSTITGKGQTTVPKPIRDALGVHSGDQIIFLYDGSQVTVRRASKKHSDPQLVGLLALFNRDIATRRNLKGAIPSGIRATMKRAHKDVKVNLDETLIGDVAL